MRYTSLFLCLCLFFISQTTNAACGGTVRTYDGGGGTPYWSIANNWSANNAPNTPGEDAILNAASAGYLWVFNGNQSIGCFEAVSGLLAWWTLSLTINGDYFRALQPGTSYIGQNSGRLIMAGTAPQTLEAVDLYPNLTITNNTSVTFTNAWSLRTAPVMSGTTTTLYIDDDFTVTTNSAWTIPSGNTVHIRNGSTVSIAGNLTVNGTLIIDAGGTLSMANGRVLAVNSGALIQLKGANGNPVTVESPSGGTFTFNVPGLINAEYFRVSRTAATGINVTGTIQKMENGEFHYIANTGYGVTLGATTSIPSTMEGLGFYNENGSASGNINASAYVGSASDTFIDNWLGDLGGETNDLDTNGSCGGDPPGCISWGTEANTQLTITNSTASGSPPTTVSASTGPHLFATFAFALTKADTATNISSITFTHTGTAEITEVSGIQVFDDDGDCVFDGGDTQIGSDLSLSGSPGTATVTIPGSTIQVSNTAPVCVHLRASISSLGVRDHNVRFEIASSDDVSNSNAYSFTASSGPPLASGLTTINGAFPSWWTGNTSSVWNTNNNWFGSFPNSTRDCKIGEGERVTNVSTNPIQCRNAELPASGTLNWASTSNVFEVYGNLDLESGYTFQNAANAELLIRGTTDQSVVIGESWPGNVTVNNTATSGSDDVLITGNSFISGNLTITDGDVTIGDGVTLQVDGDISIGASGSLTIEPGGTLTLANGSAVIVTGGLNLLGSASKTATVTSTGASNSYTVTVNGSIAARYYTFSRMGGNGITIANGASIDATNHLQDGAFTEPVTNGTNMLRLFQQVPGGTIDNMNFDASGSGATGIVNIYTDATAGAGTLIVDNYAGDLSGPTFDNDNTYLLSWTNATNTIHITQGAATPASLSAGSTSNMGRWVFQQALPGASFNNTDITSLRVTMTGTGTTSDVDEMLLYYDDNCDSTGGSLIGTGTPSGTPGSVTFTIPATQATVEADVASPPTRCLYVEYDISSAASDGQTLGAQISQSSHFVNDQSYGPSGSTSFPVTLGTPGTISGSTLTIWTGATNTNWNTASNWTAGVPSAAVSCEIPSAGNNPVINGITGTCNNVDITNGTLTIQGGGTLEAYGNMESTGTISQVSGNISIRDNGATNTDQTVSSSSTISLTFNKTAGGNVIIGENTTLSALTFPGGSNFTFAVQSGKTLTMNSSFSVVSGVTFNMQSSSTLAMASSTTINVTGGTFQTSGVNDAFPQTTSNKATITRSGGGRWSFVATSGTVTIQGAILDYIDVNGLQINGTSNLSQLDGAQFTNLLADFATPVRAIQLNTSATITETTASNFGWHWAGANANYSGSPTPSDNYFLVYAPDCGGQSLTFSQWFGDFWGTSPQPETQDKIFDSADGANNCTVSIDASASPVSITQMSATPYNSVVDVFWQTGSELDHQGFNIFRSTNPNSGLVQVNSQLIKNITSSANGRGDYAFRDETVTNGSTYYYYIEDIATNGTTTMHGPVSATPSASLASAPTLPNNDGSDTIDQDPTDSGNNDSDTQQVAPDVKILSQSSNTLRIEITPDTVTLTTSVWDSNYNTIHIPHFSATTTAGHPELLERTILVPLSSPFTAISSNEVLLNETSVISSQIAPAAAWTLNPSTQNLQPSWAENSAIYSQNQFIGANYYEIETETRSIQNEHYLAIKVWPVKYNPVAQQYKQISRVVLDIYTGSEAWPEPTTLTNLYPPSHADNIARLKFNRSGMYELSYNDLVTHNSDGSLSGADITEIQLYQNGSSIPLEVQSVDGLFNSGDTLRFYIHHTDSIEHAFSYAYLSPVPLYGEASNRMNSTAAPYDINQQTQQLGLQRVKFEQNNQTWFDQPMGGHVDHSFWTRLYVDPATAGGAQAIYTFNNLDLENIEPDSAEAVILNLSLRARGTDFHVSPRHKIALYINGEVTASLTHEFTGSLKQTLSLSLPANKLTNTNSLKLEILSDNLSSGQYSIVDVDFLEFEYPQVLQKSTDQLIIHRPALSDNIQIYDYTTEPSVYDISVPTHTTKITTATWNGANNAVSFNAPSSLISDNGPVGITGTRFISLADDQFLSVNDISVNHGYSETLKSNQLQADLIIIGSANSLSAAQALASHRQAQGLVVKTIEHQQIFNDFSHGRPDTQAIKDFLMHAYNNWQLPKPKYVLFIGDSSLDPLNHGGNDGRSDVLASRLVQGVNSDFSSDVWFVSDEIQEGLFLPLMAVGRIPTESTAEIQAYINKLIQYESGQLLSDSGKHQISFASDISANSEGFSELSNHLSTTAQSAFSSLSTSNVLRDGKTDADFKADILNIINQDKPFVVAFNGHGAEDMWADSAVFGLSDIASLTNTDSLPIAIAMNCLNGTTQFSNKATKGIGESLALKSSGGAIAFWGSTALTSPKTQEALATHFFSSLGQQLASGNSSTRLGDTMLQAQRQLNTVSGYQDVIQSWSFIGDPSMKLPEKSFAATSVATQPQPSNSGGSSGCSANAAYADGTHKAPLDLILAFLLEVLLSIVLLRSLFYLRRRAIEK